MAEAVTAVLLVDDDRRWVRVTRDVLTARDPQLRVTTATTLAAATEALLTAPDIVVCDYQLDDGDGLMLLERVRERDGALPFILITGVGTEALAAAAIGEGVTDYIRKNIPDETDLLLEAIHTHVRRYRETTATTRRQRILADVGELLTQVEDLDAAADALAELLAATFDVEAVWVGTLGTGRLEAVGGGTPRRIDMAADAPAATAARAGTIIARQRTVAVPITDARTTFGAVSVTFTAAPDGRTRTTLRAVGDRLGGLFRAVLWRTALMEDGLTPVSVAVRDTQLPLVRAAAAAETTVAITSIGRADATQTAYVLTPTDPEAAAAFIRALEADGAVAWVQPVGETDRVLAGIDGPSPAARVIDSGGTIVGGRVDPTTLRLQVRLPALATGGLTEALEAAGRRVRLRAMGTLSPEPPAVDAALTDRQREVLRFAYHGGFFERPQGATAGELATALDISASTFLHHIRTAEQKLIGAHVEPAG